MKYYKNVFMLTMSQVLIHIPEVLKRSTEMCVLSPPVGTADQPTHYIIHESAAVLPGVSQSVHSQLVRCVGLSSDWLAASLVRAEH